MCIYIYEYRYGFPKTKDALNNCNFNCENDANKTHEVRVPYFADQKHWCIQPWWRYFASNFMGDLSKKNWNLTSKMGMKPRNKHTILYTVDYAVYHD